MKKRFFGIVLVLSVLMALPAFALDLHQARSAGIVGEKTDGYIAALKNTPEANALVRDVNEKRRQEYTRISQENKQPVETVARLAAEHIINGLESGQSYQDVDGRWKVHP
jgi:uncharacterized protein YdbL (DUF1318 family)